MINNDLEMKIDLDEYSTGKAIETFHPYWGDKLITLDENSVNVSMTFLPLKHVITEYLPCCEKGEVFATINFWNKSTIEAYYEYSCLEQLMDDYGEDKIRKSINDFLVNNPERKDLHIPWGMQPIVKSLNHTDGSYSSIEMRRFKNDIQLSAIFLPKQIPVEIVNPAFCDGKYSDDQFIKLAIIWMNNKLNLINEDIPTF